MDGIKIVAVSDLHFGNPRIDALGLYEKLKKYLYPELVDAHIVFICGDLYDQLLTVSSKSHRYAVQFITDLLRASSKTGMQIRLLHGTYTHDRDQLTVLQTAAPKSARFEVINNIHAEDITDIRNGDSVYPGSLSVAYIPDNLSFKKSEEVIEHLNNVLKCLGKSNVDLLIGHGTFEHVIPPDSGHRPPCLYRREQFTNLVSGLVIMGHIHIHGKTDNVHYCGSFERMAHGEEEDKGFYVFTKEKDDNTWKSRFVLNKDATRFITLQPEGPDMAATANDFIAKVKEKFPGLRGFVRVLHQSTEVRALLHKTCAQNFPNIGYSSKSTGERSAEKLDVSEITLDIFEDIKPDIHNLGDLTYKFLEERNLLDGITRDRIVEAIDNLIEGK